jgi:HAD superfamily hydrolase (TIGR01509 family)
MTRALFFDFDGLILDTEVPEYRAWQEVYATHGVELPRAEWTAIIGVRVGTFDPYARLEELVGHPVDRAAVRATRRARFEELMAAQTVLPGVTAYLDDAVRLGLRVAVVSSSSRQWITRYLAQVGLADRFEAILCADDVADVKPSPELYLKALATVGVTCDAAVALEDSPNGIAAAVAAGIRCVAVPNGMTADLDLSAAHLRILSLAEVRLEEVLERVASRHDGACRARHGWVG